MSRATVIRALTLAVSLAAAVRASEAQKPCAAPVTPHSAHFYIEPVPPAPGDTVSARLCLAVGANPIGSYAATITYDSTRMRAVRFDPMSGMQVANPSLPGTIRIAGISPAGFPTGQLASIVFVSLRSKALSALRLEVGEVSTSSGTSVLKDTRASGWPLQSAEPRATPVIDSIRPTAGEVDAERVTDLVLYGKGFAASGNVVLFGGAEVGGLLSEANGTVIRFAAPPSLPSTGSGTARRLLPGPIDVRVKNEAGTSNAVTFVVRAGRLP